jgi:hypothetical protein
MLQLLVAVLVAVTAVLASLWLFIAPKLRPPIPSLRGPPSSSVLLGNIDILATGKMHENFRNLAQTYGAFVSIRFLWNWVRRAPCAAAAAGRPNTHNVLTAGRVCKAVVVNDGQSASELLRAGRRAVVKPASAYWFFNHVGVELHAHHCT